MHLTMLNLKPSLIVVRISHTILVLNVVLTPFACKSVFTDGIRSADVTTIIESTLYVILAATSLLFYFFACFKDPGYVPLPQVYCDSDDSEDEQEVIGEDAKMTENDGLKLRHCGFCGIRQPIRAKHCEDCGRCVRRFDHHCPWLGVCVGEGNHKFFLLFLTTTLAGILCSVYILWNSFDVRENFMETLKWNGMWIISGVIVASGGMSVVTLLSIHAYLAASNLTTWEFLARHRISYLKNIDFDENPFHLGYFRNCFMFLCACGFQNWEKVYQKFVIKRRRRGFDC